VERELQKERERGDGGGAKRLSGVGGMGAGRAGEQQEKMDASRYVTEIKSSFANQPHVYNNFLRVLQVHGSLDPQSSTRTPTPRPSTPNPEPGLQTTNPKPHPSNPQPEIACCGVLRRVAACCGVLRRVAGAPAGHR